MIKFLIPLLLVVVMASTVESKETLITYKNKKYGIELQYPPDFEAVEGRDDHWKFDYTVFKPKDKEMGGNVTISYNGPQVWRYAKENSLAAFFMGTAYAEPQPPLDQGKIKVDGVEGVHELMDFGLGEIHNITIHNNGVKFDIGASWGYTADFAPQEPLPDHTQEKKIILEAFQQILASLRFTERTSVDPVQR